MIYVIRLTRELIDIPSVSGEEFQIGTSIGDLLVRRGVIPVAPVQRFRH